MNILKNGEKNILHINNSYFDSLHNQIKMVTEDSNIILSHSLKIMIEKMDQEVYGVGCIYLNIVDFLKTQNDALAFAHLVKQALDQKQKSECPYHHDVYELILNFHQELLKYADTLKGQ